MKDQRIPILLLSVALISAQCPTYVNLQQPQVKTLPGYQSYGSTVPQTPLTYPNEAVCYLIASTGSTVSGEIRLQQASQNNPVEITASIQGLRPPGLHGFHLHRDGNTDNDCKAAGPHFNPFNHTHGGPDDAVRHAGDFGNILANEYGIATIQIQGTLISLHPGDEGYAVGRAFVVHEGTDDLGKGGNEESLKTGNAGGRLACCIVAVINY